MSTLVSKPKKVRILNPKLLTIAGVLLLVLGLSFLATPLLSTASGTQGNGGNMPAFDGQTFPGGIPQGQVPQGQVPQGQEGLPLTARDAGGPGGLMMIGRTGGMGSTLLYGIALLVSLAAASGMFMAKRWGQVLGTIMAVLYLLFALVSLLPTLLVAFMGFSSPLNLVLGFVNLLLAVAVIVLVSIPGRKPAVVPAASTAPSRPD
jgi:hypothetical protein